VARARRVGHRERGIFNAEAASRACSRREALWNEWKRSGGTDLPWSEVGPYLRPNPCFEILLNILYGQFCNLTEVVIRAGDTLADVAEKVRSAVWLGAMQASLTDFKYIRESFKEVCDQERLLGVSLTGQMDNPAILTPANLRYLNGVAVSECRLACAALGTNMSAAITTGKPSGTVSQLVNCASGAHARYAKYYLRRYRISANDRMFRMLRDQGLPFNPENGQGPADLGAKRALLVERGRTVAEAEIIYPSWTEDSVQTWVCEFPEKAPEGAVTRHDVSAIGQLEWYLKLKQNWCEHNQSITVYVRDEEWDRVGEWVWEHFDDLIGVSFLPFDGGKYEQPPYEEISAEEYARRVADFPRLDYSKLSFYEQDDNTTGAQALACSGTSCESR
jgi:hypothetical protein